MDEVTLPYGVVEVGDARCLENAMAGHGRLKTGRLGWQGWLMFFWVPEIMMTPLRKKKKKKTHMSPENRGWKTTSLLKWPLFSGHSLVFGGVHHPTQITWVVSFHFLF